MVAHEKPDPLIDVVVGNKYRVIRKIGEGGMSAIYEARHVKLQRQFALKRLLLALVRNEEAMLRFEREAEMLAGLRHPNVVEISDWDMLPDGAPCMILEFLHGAPLLTRMQRGPMQWEAIARIGDQVMSALSLAHRMGITHRDLKPENIFMAIDDVGDERVKLLDFGVSKLRGAGNTTGVFAMLGTPAYMAPEQATGNSDAIGPHTDVWAIAAILYEMATGRVAFPGATLTETLMRITNESPVPMLQFRPDASPAFVQLIEYALSHDPAKRIQTIDELRGGLREALDPEGEIHRSHTPMQAMQRLQIPIAQRPSRDGITPLPSTHARASEPKLEPQAVARPNRRLLWIVLAGLVAGILATVAIVLLGG